MKYYDSIEQPEVHYLNRNDPIPDGYLEFTRRDETGSIVRKCKVHSGSILHADGWVEDVI